METTPEPPVEQDSIGLEALKRALGGLVVVGSTARSITVYAAQLGARIIYPVKEECFKFSRKMRGENNSTTSTNEANVHIDFAQDFESE